jgi:hypothetical protein
MHTNFGKYVTNRELWELWHKWEDNITVDFREIECEDADLIQLLQDRVQ